MNEPRDLVLKCLTDHVINELLDGSGVDLDEHSPLLQWGILNSLAIIQLIGFIERRFNVVFPDEMVTAKYFKNLGVLADAVAVLCCPRSRNSTGDLAREAIPAAS